MLTSLLEQERGAASDQRLWVAARERPSPRNPPPGCFSDREKLSPAILDRRRASPAQPQTDPVGGHRSVRGRQLTDSRGLSARWPGRRWASFRSSGTVKSGCEKQVLLSREASGFRLRWAARAARLLPFARLAAHARVRADRSAPPNSHTFNACDIQTLGLDPAVGYDRVRAMESGMVRLSRRTVTVPGCILPHDHQDVGRNVLQTAIIRYVYARPTSRMPRGDPVHGQFMAMLMRMPPSQRSGGIHYGGLYRLLYRRGGSRTAQMKCDFSTSIRYGRQACGDLGCGQSVTVMKSLSVRTNAYRKKAARHIEGRNRRFADRISLL